MTDKEAAITLNLIPGLGSIKIQRLIDFFGTPEIALHADVKLLQQVRGIGPEQANIISSWRTTINVEKEIHTAEQAGASITTIFDSSYPASLRNIPDPPIVIYSLGNIASLKNNRSVAIVGSRLATHYGRLSAKRFAYELAESGITIISGLARGIDTEAHKATLDAGGTTIAVIGSGLNQLYPRENTFLAQSIIEQGGAVISEFPMDLRPGKTTFPMRNRIISALSSATLVVEAPLKSGSLITANQAAEQGRQVYAIPGPIDRPQSDGCHELIRNGAILVTKPVQILEDMGWDNTQQTLPLFQNDLPEKSNTSIVLSDQEQLVISRIKQGFNSLDSLCSSCGIPANELTPILAKLQIKHAIRPIEGGLFAPVG